MDEHFAIQKYFLSDFLIHIPSSDTVAMDLSKKLKTESEGCMQEMET